VRFSSNVIGGEQFLDDHHLVTHLAEAHQKIAVGGGRVHFVAKFHQRAAGGFEPLRGGEGQQAGLSVVLMKSNFSDIGLFEFE
jgi:hypothetical protein